MNWFKKNKLKEAIFNKENIIAELPKVATKLYPKEVQEIHHEFHTAADRLVEEANIVLKEATNKDISKVSRLEALGFKQASQVIELKPLLQKAELSKEQLELVKYYQREYPLNKFITEEQVKAICYKYNLVCGEVSRFKGFVPEKNLKEIERFSLKDKDIKYYKIYQIEKWGFTPNSNWSTEEISKESFDYQSKSNLWLVNYTFKTNNELFSICAPIKDMDISGLELKDGYKLEKKFIPDPVVLQPVQKGYLIITAWGDEASDELVVNQKFN